MDTLVCTGASSLVPEGQGWFNCCRLTGLQVGGGPRRQLSERDRPCLPGAPDLDCTSAVGGPHPRLQAQQGTQPPGRGSLCARAAPENLRGGPGRELSPSGAVAAVGKRVLLILDSGVPCGNRRRGQSIPSHPPPPCGVAAKPGKTWTPRAMTSFAGGGSDYHWGPVHGNALQIF